MRRLDSARHDNDQRNTVVSGGKKWRVHLTAEGLVALTGTALTGGKNNRQGTGRGETGDKGHGARDKSKKQASGGYWVGPYSNN